MKYITPIIMLFLCQSTFGQTELEKVLGSITNNNKSILAYKQLMEAKTTSYKTGLTLSNPTVEYDYMQGNTGGSSQTDITALQSFDFPTSYIRKKQLSKLNITKLAVLQKDYIQEVLLEAKLQYVQLIYLNKHKAQLSTRKDNATAVAQASQIKFDAGVTNELDLNKSKINLITAQNQLQEATREITLVSQKLSELNGGNMLTTNATSYPINDSIGSLEDIMSEAIKGDYHLQVIQQDEIISKKQAQVNKALAMPKLEGGYRYQSILGQAYSGFHAGISIPLFENKNKIKTANQQVKYFNLQAESHKNEHHIELESLYEKASSLRKNKDAYQKLLGSMNSYDLLKLAFDAGEISSIEYFMELNYYYDANDDLLILEREYNLTLAQLMKYKL